MAKLKLAVYWAASCGGCDVSILDTNERILDIAGLCDIVFWPCAMDFKYRDVEAMEDDAIDICLFNGAIRTSEHEHVAKLLRRKTKIMVAYGSCAHMGGIPGLGNVADREQIFDVVYRTTPSTANPKGTRPQTLLSVPEGELTLPEFWDTVKTLDQVIPVEYYIPGCPPATVTINAVVDAIAANALPPVGATVGGTKTLCDECPLEKSEERKIKVFKRPYEIKPDPDKCLLEQGIVCCGPATRAGCGAQCINANMPCRGCYGPADGVIDQGAKLLSAIASMIDSNDPEEIDWIISQIKDPLGTFYRFGLPLGLLHRVRLSGVAAPGGTKKKETEAATQ